MNLFEGIPAAVALQQMSTTFPRRLLGRTQRLSLLIIPGGHRFEPWIRAYAIRSTLLLGEVDLAPDLAQWLTDEPRLVSETAAPCPHRCGQNMKNGSPRRAWWPPT